MDQFLSRLTSVIAQVIFPTSAAVFLAVHPSPTPTPRMLHQSEIITIFTTPSPTSTPIPTSTPSPQPTAAPLPTSTPVPTQIPVSGNEMDGWFTKYANEYGLDRKKFWLVAVCESGLRTNAVNGDYGGLFQFASSTWHSARSHMNLDSDTSLRYHAEESIRTAAFKISRNGYSAWPSCSK